MRFDYQYRTRENELKSGSVSAASREAAYKALKSQGINPSRVTLAPGALNYLASFGKRSWLIVILAVALAVTLAFSSRRPTPAPASPNGDIDPDVLKQLEASGMDVEVINELLAQRRKINEEYREKIEAEVERGTLTRKAADAMLRAAGLTTDESRKEELR